MAKFKDLGDKLEKITNEATSFKIGKTSHAIEEYYQKHYINEFTNYYQVGASKDSDVIERFEDYLLDRFKEHKKYNGQNKKTEGLTNSAEHIVYLVYNC